MSSETEVKSRGTISALRFMTNTPLGWVKTDLVTKSIIPSSKPAIFSEYETRAEWIFLQKL
jgi:hypothetical protein